MKAASRKKCLYAPKSLFSLKIKHTNAYAIFYNNHSFLLLGFNNIFSMFHFYCANKQYRKLFIVTLRQFMTLRGLEYCLSNGSGEAGFCIH
jgi:hypothetical protein